MIVKVRDYGSRIPTDFGHEFREALLEWCVAQAFLRSGKAAIDEQRREATFVLTDPSLDSYGEIIDAGAFDRSLPGFLRNPVVLPEHQHRLPGGPHCAIVGNCRFFMSNNLLWLLAKLKDGNGRPIQQRSEATCRVCAPG